MLSGHACVYLPRALSTNASQREPQADLSPALLLRYEVKRAGTMNPVKHHYDMIGTNGQEVFMLHCTNSIGGAEVSRGAPRLRDRGAPLQKVWQWHSHHLRT